jgi:hypothetical protein
MSYIVNYNFKLSFQTNLKSRKAKIISSLFVSKKDLAILHAFCVFKKHQGTIQLLFKLTKTQ